MSTQIKEYSTNFKAILAIDFDHTICMSEYPELGSERENAGIIMRKLIAEGYGIVINTCREGVALANAILWMHKNNIPYHFVNCNFPHLITMFGADCRKISADIYIDDKMLGGLPGWNIIYELITNNVNV